MLSYRTVGEDSHNLNIPYKCHVRRRVEIVTPNHLCSDYFLSFFFQLKRSCFRCEEMNKQKKRPHEKEGNMVNNVNRKTLWQTYLIIKRGQKMTTNEEKCKRDKKLCSRKLNVCLVLTNRNLLTSYLKEKESGRMKKKKCVPPQSN